MKTRISKLILITFLLGVVFLLHSCGETAASTNPTAPTETPDVISAAEEYADVINESLKAATKFDFDGMHQHYAADALLAGRYYRDPYQYHRQSGNGSLVEKMAGHLGY